MLEKSNRVFEHFLCTIGINHKCRIIFLDVTVSGTGFILVRWTLTEGSFFGSSGNVGTWLNGKLPKELFEEELVLTDVEVVSSKSEDDCELSPNSRTSLSPERNFSLLSCSLRVLPSSHSVVGVSKTGSNISAAPWQSPTQKEELSFSSSFAKWLPNCGLPGI